jgi:flagellar biosynthetic protein FliR
MTPGPALIHLDLSALPGWAFLVLLVFARVGAALMVMPGFGEPQVLPRLRLGLALALSLLLASARGEPAPAVPETSRLMGLVAGETVFGLAIGTAARLAFTAVHVAGSIIAAQSGLAAATFFDPSEATQSPATATFLGVTTLTLLFVTDGHHLLLRALSQSYALQPLGAPLPLGDLGDLMTRLAGTALAAGLAMAAPVLLTSLLGNLVLGLLNRLVPSLQIFFVALPLQLALTFALLAMGVGGVLLLGLGTLRQGVAWLAGAG